MSAASQPVDETPPGEPAEPAASAAEGRPLPDPAIQTILDLGCKCPQSRQRGSPNGCQPESFRSEHLKSGLDSHARHLA